VCPSSSAIFLKRMRAGIKKVNPIYGTLAPSI
jgi:hypothetical protein